MLRGHTFIGDFSQESSKYIRAVKRLRVSAFLSASFLLIFAGIAAACAKEQTLPIDTPTPDQEWDASKYLVGFGASMEDITKAVELLESIYYQDSQTGAHTGTDKD